MRFKSCPECRGQGKLTIQVKCPGCDGEGSITDRQAIGSLADLVSPELLDKMAAWMAEEEAKSDER